jgi:hypothetical protein
MEESMLLRLIYSIDMTKIFEFNALDLQSFDSVKVQAFGT